MFVHQSSIFKEERESASHTWTGGCFHSRGPYSSRPTPLFIIIIPAVCWDDQLLRIWQSEASKDLVGQGKCFEVDSGFYGQPMKRSTYGVMWCSCSCPASCRFCMTRTLQCWTRGYRSVIQSKNMISWSIPEEFRAKHNDLSFVQFEGKEIRGHPRLSWRLTSCSVSSGFQLITGRGSASVSHVKRQLEDALHRRLFQAEPTAWMQHQPPKLSPLLQLRLKMLTLMVMISVSGGRSHRSLSSEQISWNVKTIANRIK